MNAAFVDENGEEPGDRTFCTIADEYIDSECWAAKDCPDYGFDKESR